MPDRILRAAILTSDRVNHLTWGAEVFYRRLMSVVDDFGRYDARPSILRAALYPLKIDRVADADIGKWLAECAEAGLVSVYRVDDKDYLQLERFSQRKRAQFSKFPTPPEDGGHLRADDSGCPSSADIGGHRRPYSYSYSYSEAHAETNTNTPLTPQGEADAAVLTKPRKSASKPATAKFDPIAVVLPDALAADSFRGIWRLWCEDRAKRRKPVTEAAAVIQLRNCEAWAVKYGLPAVITMVESAISGSWQGLFEPKPDNARASQQQDIFAGLRESRERRLAANDAG